MTWSAFGVRRGRTAPGKPRKGAGLRLRPAVPQEPGTGRRCDQCGDFIDPADWCAQCINLGAACATAGGPHRRLYKRADACFCNNACRSEHRASFIRDCL